MASQWLQPPEDFMWQFQKCSLPVCEAVYRCRRERQTLGDNSGRKAEPSKLKEAAHWTAVVCHKTGEETFIFDII